MVKVSVLVAVYNASGYLPHCLDSLLGQTMRDVQVICVDDASTDTSLSIIQSYAQRDARVEVLALSVNHGQAYARNQALAHARGMYTCFLDSDDWLAADALEQVVSVFERDSEIDSVLFDCRYYYSPDRIEPYPMPDFGVIPGKQAFEESLSWRIHGVYAVRTPIHLRFPYDTTCHSYSDDNTTRLHYLASRKVATSGGIYFYRQHDASVTHQVSVRRFDYLRANAGMRQSLQRAGVSRRILSLYENERWRNVVDMYLFYWRHGKEMSTDDRVVALGVLRSSWGSIDTGALIPRYKYKLGYFPCRCRLLPDAVSWRLFTLQANVYFFLKRLMHKI